MCLDNKKLLSLETFMATNPLMYSRTQKKQHEKKKKNRGQLKKQFNLKVFANKKETNFSICFGCNKLQRLQKQFKFT